jgi:iron complex transport system permease protein
LLSLLLLLAAGALAAALAIGSIALSPGQMVEAIDHPGLARDIILDLRLPRALGAFAAGALLALAGALMQVLLGNPLADPYILGVSGGSAVGALLAMLLGFSGLPVTVAAFIGAIISTLLVFGLTRGRSAPPIRLLLTGVVIAAGWGAAISFLLAIAPENSLRGMVFWLMGDLSQVQSPTPAFFVLALGMAAAIPFARDLNLLVRGELQAGALGVNVSRLRLHLYLVASLLTATAVTLGGSIGFVGLVVPHLLRLVGLSDHRVLLPASALLGGSLLVLADTLGRSLIAPQQLPVGVLTALIGVPLFLFLLGRSGK